MKLAPAIVLVALFSGCQKSDTVPTPEPAPPSPSARTPLPHETSEAMLRETGADFSQMKLAIEPEVEKALGIDEFHGYMARWPDVAVLFFWFHGDEDREKRVAAVRAWTGNSSSVKHAKVGWATPHGDLCVIVAGTSSDEPPSKASLDAIAKLVKEHGK